MPTGIVIDFREKKLESMKKIAITILFAGVAFLGAEAQSKSSRTEKISKADYAKNEQDRATMYEEARLDRLRYDSVRHAKDSLKQAAFDSTRLAWKDSVSTYQDSINTVKYQEMALQSAQWRLTDQEREAVVESANLSENQSRQVLYINQSFGERASTIKENELLTDAEKQAELFALNKERVEKLKTVLGKSKARKLERKRKEYAKKNGAIEADAWIDTANAYAASNPSEK